MIQRAVAAFALLLVGCGEPSLKAAGEECFASSECALGLVCDLAASPAVCSEEGTPPDVDAPVVDAPAVDAALLDGSLIDAPVPVDAAEVEVDAPPVIDAAPDAEPPPDAKPVDAAPPIDAQPIDAPPA